MSLETKGFKERVGATVENATSLSPPHVINIHVVDDERQQVDLMIEMMGMTGLTSNGFTSASDFIKQPISNHDIVLLDLNMPDMDGIEVMRVLHERGCLPTYILISGFDDRVLHSAKQFADAKKITVKETFTKPLDTKKFIQRIFELHSAKTKALLQADYTTTNNPINKQEYLTLSDLKTALEKHYFILHYQPQVDMQTGKLHGFEALIRMQHPDLGLVFPDQIIGLAEQNFLISEITNEVINLSCNDYWSFCDIGIKPKISINISAQDLLDLSMPEHFTAKVDAHNIPHEALIVELTESSILTSVSDSLDILNRLRMKGFSLSIDDFGTGNSSLVQLYQAPFTELKIDQHFIMRMMEDDEAMSIVKICILLAKELRMDTVAEGVETQEIWDKLKELGCKYAQGYHISKPIPLDACSEWALKNQ